MDPWGLTAVAYLLSLLGAASGGPECLALAGLDLQRSQAISSVSPEGLAELFVDDAAAAPDLAALRQWSDRGMVLESAMLVVGSCTVAAGDAGQVVLEVVDRLAPTRAVDTFGGLTDLPQDDWSRRSVVLHHVDGRWRYAGGTLGG
ncbi:hypothetical protein [Aeromicrobium sp. Leaf350]|uniref:hypothetical protein n=1 Tax=Aeromicrobium sp. Leaf350 TaxID=2876565 RepID=UPI001E316505|nr:hypothetical protein [Aeromicrobium sp. Leaf350]